MAVIAPPKQIAKFSMASLATKGRGLPSRLIIHGTEGVGKAQPLDAKVLTPYGFVNMGDIEIGSRVIGSDGKPHHVLGVYPQGVKDVYRVTFRDGSATECCDDHLWFTQTRSERDRGLAGAVRTMRDIRKTLRYGTHFNHGIPRVQPIEFEQTSCDVPIEPWLLGVYLGDGHCEYEGNVNITNPEEDVQARIAAALSEDDALVVTGSMSLRVKRRHRNNCSSDFKASLNDLGLSGCRSHEKFIPSMYLHASVYQRLALLRGLLDTDGFVKEPSTVEFSTSSPRLADDVCYLIRSLGGSVKWSTRTPHYTHKGERRDGRLAYRLFASFPCGVVPVSSEKHLAKWAEPEFAVRHFIKTVDYVGQKECQCIIVDAPDSLYVTDDFILTHNTSVAAYSPKPVFVMTRGETGLETLMDAGQLPGIPHFPEAQSFQEVMAMLDAVLKDEHDYKTLVIDTMNGVERLCHEMVCEREYNGDWGKKGFTNFMCGFEVSLADIERFLMKLDAIREQRKMSIIGLCHTLVKSFKNPEGPDYDRYQAKMHDKTWNIIKAWADIVLFVNYDVTVDADAGSKKGKGYGGATRIMYTQRRASFDAKNRHGLPEEIEMGNSGREAWANFVNAMKKKG